MLPSQAAARESERSDSEANVRETEFGRLTQKIARDRGFSCANYKAKCLQRRIAVRMRARAVHGYAEYGGLLDSDPAEYDRLLDALTINVTKLFRNWDAYAALAERVIPVLARASSSAIRVWSAGCSSGDEPYSLAILFHQYAVANGLDARLSRLSVLGTDIDRRCLAAAARGEFTEGDFSDTPDDIRRRYFSDTTPAAVIPAVRRLVRCEHRDLLAAPPPPGPHDLIVCRNVLIYFERDTQERLFGEFHAALAPGGFLMLGKVETLLGVARTRFAPIDARARIFQRL